MFKEAMKTYWKNMKYVLTVLGILFVTLLIGLTIFFNSAGVSVQQVRDEITAYAGENDFSGDRISEAITGESNEKIGDAIAGTIVTYANMAGVIAKSLGVGLLKIIGAIILFLVIEVIGIWLCHDIIFILARYNREKDNILEVWFELYVKNVLVLISAGIIAYIFSFEKIQIVGIVLACAYPLIYCFISLLSEWIAAGRERPKFTKVVTFKNTLILFAENLVVILISIAIAIACFYLFGLLVSFYVVLTLLILTAVSISLNAQAFIFGSNAWKNYLPDKTKEEETVEIETKDDPKEDVVIIEK